MQFVHKHNTSTYKMLGSGELKQFRGHCSVQSKMDDVTMFGLEDMVYEYISDGDVFRLFFIHISPDMVMEKIVIATNIVLWLDKNGKILALEFLHATSSLGCHLFNNPADIEGLPPCVLNWKYETKNDTIVIDFMTETESAKRFYSNIQAEEPYELDIVLEVDKDKRYTSLDILRASKILQKNQK
eukprot:TRINITY_DN16404_c0_g1_i1.p1 TRINITY_DN16404_c0_g1~~TRINITY_DN16404_c0_g1_i1.p1  ORF type:complete len:185 (+),score=28.41 TRINITY_DN16404_c0_g1_i1:79-633(+)